MADGKAGLLAEPQRVAIRFDASRTLGGGHAVRCLALADRLAARGADVLLLTNVEARDMVPALTQRHRWRSVEPGGAAACAALQSVWPDGADLAIVDHYGWAAAEERLLRPGVRQLAVIDDLANRVHACDLLVDQNAGRIEGDYAGLVGPGVPLLVGSRYALLRPAFAALRNEALARRAKRVSACSDAPPRVLVSAGLASPPSPPRSRRVPAPR